MAVKKKKWKKAPMSTLSSEVTSSMRSMGDRTRHIHPEIWARWHIIAGPKIYSKSFPIFFKDNKLTIAVTSASWLQQLNFLKGTLLDALAESIGPNIVKEIRFVQDSSIGRYRKPVFMEKEKISDHEPDMSKLPLEIGDSADKIDDIKLAQSIKRAAASFLEKKNK